MRCIRRTQLRLLGNFFLPPIKRYMWRGPCPFTLPYFETYKNAQLSATTVILWPWLTLFNAIPELQDQPWKRALGDLLLNKIINVLVFKLLLMGYSVICSWKLPKDTSMLAHLVTSHRWAWQGIGSFRLSLSLYRRCFSNCLRWSNSSLRLLLTQFLKTRTLSSPMKYWAVRDSL